MNRSPRHTENSLQSGVSVEAAGIEPAPHSHRPGSDLNQGHSRKISRTRRWQELRARALERAGHKCEVCGIADRVRGTLRAHHLNYERPNEELLEDIQILCSWCHGRAHSWWETEGKYLPDDDPAFDGWRPEDLA